MTTDSAINFLRKRKQEASKVNPATTTQGLLSKLNNNIIGALADISEVFLKHQPKVSVSNFPKVERIDFAPVIKAIKEIPIPKETDTRTVLPKPVDLTPVLKAINNLPIPEPINLSPVVQAIRDIPEPKKFPEEFKVKNQIALDRVEDLLSKAVRALEKAPETKNDQLLITELRSLFLSLTEAVSDVKTTSVRVSNAGEFPVTFPIPSFRDVNGNTAQAKLSADGYVITIDASQTALGGYKISDVDDTSSTKYYGYIAIDGNWYILKEASNTYRYAKGSSTYSTNWTNRVGLTYDYYNEIF